VQPAAPDLESISSGKPDYPRLHRLAEALDSTGAMAGSA